MKTDAKPEKAQPFDFDGTIVAPKERATVHLPVSELYTQTPLSLPIRIVHGRRKGPVLLCTAGIHGDEINGTEILRRLLRMRALNRMRGTLIAAPIVNVHGFIALSRYFPDRRDLNRMFPGSETGPLASRLAWMLMEKVVRRSTHAIDLHTASNNRFNIPQIRTQKSKETLRLATIFGAPIVVQSKPPEGSFREAAHQAGIPILLYEAGEALRFDETAIRVGLQGVLSVMRDIGMLPEKPHRRRIEPYVAQNSRWVRSEYGGIFIQTARLGAAVLKGALLGYVGDPFGDRQSELRSPIDGIIIGIQRLPLVNRGDALMHIASAGGETDGWQDLQQWEQELVPVDPGDDHLGPPTTT